ncbi:hypothetical protein D3C75_816180 [compost metagenome]
MPVSMAINVTAGTVSEIVASTEPKNRFIARCTWLLSTALNAPKPSGERINSATRKPVNCAGAFSVVSSDSSGPAFILVTAMTATKCTISQMACQVLLCADGLP